MTSDRPSSKVPTNGANGNVGCCYFFFFFFFAFSFGFGAVLAFG